MPGMDIMLLGSGKPKQASYTTSNTLLIVGKHL